MDQNLKIKVIPKKNKDENWKGKELFITKYPNTYIVSKKHSGKTNTLYNILLHYCTSNSKNKTNTIVIIWCPTIHRDESWGYILEWLKKNNIPFIVEESIFSDSVKRSQRVNRLDILIDYLKDKNSDISLPAIEDLILYEMPRDKKISQLEIENKEKKVVDKKVNPNDSRCYNAFYEYYLKPSQLEIENKKKEEEKETKKEKIIDNEYIMIFDDISHQLKDTTISKLLKINRHLKVRTFISNQYYKDLDKSARIQMDYIIMFKNMNEEHLEDIREELSIPLKKDEFIDLYHKCTTDYNFIYIDTNRNQIRQNFDNIIL